MDMAHKYYSIMRPVSIGTFPDNGTILGIVNFDTRQMVESIGKMAWDYINYGKPLTEKQISDYELVAERPADYEDKQLICDYLLETLKLTRGQSDLETLVFDPKTEIVTGTYKNGGKVTINVACDSGVSMIRDIMAKM